MTTFPEPDVRGSHKHFGIWWHTDTVRFVEGFFFALGVMSFIMCVGSLILHASL